MPIKAINKNKLNIIFIIIFLFAIFCTYSILFFSRYNNNQIKFQPYTRTETLMDTFITIKLWNISEKKANYLLNIAFNVFSLIEKWASFHNKESVLVKLNTQKYINTNFLFGYLLLLTDKVVKETYGYFDPTIASLYELYGYFDDIHTKLPSEIEIQEVLEEKVGWVQRVKLDRVKESNEFLLINNFFTKSFNLISFFTNKNNKSCNFLLGNIFFQNFYETIWKIEEIKFIYKYSYDALYTIIKFLHETFVDVQLASNTIIDLGGIAGGFAVDLVSEVLRLNQCKTFFIDDGGDIFVEGYKPDKSKWRIGVKDPRNNGIIAIVSTNDPVAISTSGDYERFIIIQGQKINHIFNPYTGQSAQDFRSVTVIASSSLYADVWSTALFAMPQKLAFETADKNNIPALFITAKDKVYLSNSAKSWFVLTE